MPEEFVAEADAIRFTYAWAADGTLSLLDGVRVAMTALPGVVLDPADAPFSGYWYELRTVTGAVLWQLVTNNPLAAVVELPDDTSPANVADDQAGGTVVTVVPAITDGVTVAVMGSPATQLDGPAVELLTHPFAETP